MKKNGPEALRVFGRFGLFPGHGGRLRLQKARLDRAGLGGEVWHQDTLSLEGLHPYLPSLGIGALHPPLEGGAFSGGEADLGGEERVPPFHVLSASTIRDLRFHKKEVGRGILLGGEARRKVFLEWDGTLPVEDFLELLALGKRGRGLGLAVDLGSALRVLAEEEYRLLGEGDVYVPKQRGWMLEGEREALEAAVAGAMVRILEALQAFLRVGSGPVHLVVHGWHPMAPRFATDHLPLGEEISYRLGEGVMEEGELLGEYGLREVLGLLLERRGPGRVTVGLAWRPVRWARELLGPWREVFSEEDLAGDGLREAEVLMAFLSHLEEGARMVREAAAASPAS